MLGEVFIFQPAENKAFRRVLADYFNKTIFPVESIC